MKESDVAFCLRGMRSYCLESWRKNRVERRGIEWEVRMRRKESNDFPFSPGDY